MSEQPMDWIEVSIHTTNEAIEPVSNIINEKGGSGVVVVNSLDLMKQRKTPLGEMFDLDPNNYPKDGVYIKTYLPNDGKQKEIIEKISTSIEELRQYYIDVGPNEITVSIVDEEDWSTAWQKYYKPVKVSDKITVAPTWEGYVPVSPEELIIELDPGMAFGTGTHATTKLSLLALEEYLNKDDIVIDVGCGSGVLSIAAVKLGAKQVFAYDLDHVAVKSTAENAKLNEASQLITVEKNNLLEGVQLQADLIVSNILAEVIVQFISDAWDNLKDGGFFLTSGMIKRKQEMVEKKLINQGFAIISVNELDDWVSIIAQKNASKQEV